MKKILLTYGTTEGQTAKIADFISDVLGSHGHEVTVVDVRETADTPDGYDAVVVGASIHMGTHDQRIVDFVVRHRDALGRLPTAFFSVSLAAYGDTAEAEGYVEEFAKRTGWRPGRVGVFGGALLYTQYGFLKRRMMRRIVRDKPGNLGMDLSRDYVYTDWDRVKAFAEDFERDLGPRSAGSSRPAGNTR